MTLRATAGIDLDIPTRTIEVDLSANREALNELIEGLTKVRDGAIEGYALLAGDPRRPGHLILRVRRADLSPEAYALVANDSDLTPPC